MIILMEITLNNIIIIQMIFFILHKKINMKTIEVSIKLIMKIPMRLSMIQSSLKIN